MMVVVFVCCFIGLVLAARYSTYCDECGMAVPYPCQHHASNSDEQQRS